MAVLPRYPPNEIGWAGCPSRWCPPSPVFPSTLWFSWEKPKRNHGRSMGNHVFSRFTPKYTRFLQAFYGSLPQANFGMQGKSMENLKAHSLATLGEWPWQTPFLVFLQANNEHIVNWWLRSETDVTSVYPQEHTSMGCSAYAYLR